MPIANWLALDFLQKAQRLTSDSRFNGAHTMARQLYLRAFTPALEAYLKLRFENRQWRLKVRHSVSHGKGFNVFGSDLDYSIIIENSFDQTTPLRRLIALYDETKALLPFIGELEIYTEAEWRHKKKVLSSHGTVLLLIWNLRKIAWEQAKLKTAPSEYHRRKCERVLGRLLAQFDATPNRHFTENFARVAPFVSTFIEANFGSAPLTPAVGSIEGFSGFLEARLCAKVEQSERDLPLSSGSAAVLAALLPDADTFFSDVELLESLRSRPQLRKALVAIASTELLVNYSVIRIGASVLPETGAWIARLQATLKKYDLERLGAGLWFS